MSDSPKCLDCYNKGQRSQTYKVSGKSLFHCKGCGRFYDKDSFEAIEFEWKNNKKVWEEWIKTKKSISIKSGTLSGTLSEK